MISLFIHLVDYSIHPYCSLIPLQCPCPYPSFCLLYIPSHSVSFCSNPFIHTQAPLPSALSNAPLAGEPAAFPCCISIQNVDMAQLLHHCSPTSYLLSSRTSNQFVKMLMVCFPLPVRPFHSRFSWFREPQLDQVPTTTFFTLFQRTFPGASPSTS